MAEVIKTTFQLRRGLASVWRKNNPILTAGEPGFERDTFKLKIGDGILAWNDLPYIQSEGGGDIQIEIDDKSITLTDNLLQLFGFEAAEVGAIPQKGEDGTLTWSVPINLIELTEIVLGDGTEENPGLLKIIQTQSEAIKKIENVVNDKFAITSIFEDTLVDYREQEIRILFTKDTNWTKQNSGEGSDTNLYYFGLKVYAPNDNIMGFKEDFTQIFTDQTLYRFENNNFAGIDENGRKYSIVWMPAAKYDEENQTWVYYGQKSSNDKFIGWDYYVEWYDINDKLVNSDSIRINLTNENCHSFIPDYYMGDYQKTTDSISTARLVADENTVVVFDGGTVDDIILV